MSKLRTVAKILLMYCIFSSASAFAEEILRVIRVSRSPVWPESYKVTRQHQGLTV